MDCGCGCGGGGDDGKGLIRIPLSELQEEDFAPLFRNSLIMALLIIAGGWLFIRLQNRPLIALEKAAKGVGRGEIPPPLPEKGASEIRSRSEEHTSELQSR